MSGIGIRHAIELHARRAPYDAALVSHSATVSWSDLRRLTAAYAAHFLQLSVAPGDVVSVITDDPLAFVPCAAAAEWCRCRFVPLSTGLAHDALSRVLDDCDPKIVVANHPERLESARAHVLAPFAESTSEEQRAWYSDVLDCRAPSLNRRDDPFVVLYTSGTTSQPQGVERDFVTCTTWWDILAKQGRLTPRSITAIATPLSSGMSIGCIFPTLVAGGTCVFAPAFGAEDLIRLSGEMRPTFCQLTPTHWMQLMDYRHFLEGAFSSYTRLVSGGARLDAGLKAQLMALFPGTFVELYGTSETGAITELSAASPSSKYGSVGIPLSDVEIVTLDENRKCQKNIDGEIAVRTTRLLSGYFRSTTVDPSRWWVDEATGKRFHRTGDIGHLDNDGYLWLKGRQKDVIIAGASNVHAVDIEAVLLMHRDVVEAAVVGRRSRVLGEVPIAFVVMRKGAIAQPGDVCRWANERLGRYQRVYAVQTLAAIPKNEIGKPLKRVLRDLADAVVPN